MNRVTRIGRERGSPARHGGATNTATAIRERATSDPGESRRSVEIGALASRLATELGDGVSACVFRAQVLKRRAVHGEIESSEVAELAQKIIDGLNPLVERLDSWVEFARSRTFALETIRLEDFFTELAAVWRVQAATRRVGLRVATDSPLPNMRMDCAKMRLVFDHLVDNALAACSDAGGTVTVRVRAPYATRVRVTVEDDGDGVPRRIEPFNLFATTKRDGAGLGLAIAKEIVNAHGGEIEYRSTRRGGSEFTVELPVKPPVEP